MRRTLAQLSSTGAHGHIVQVVDPAEETFPYSGRVEFIEPEGGGSITTGRAEAWKRDYVARVARHRDDIREETGLQVFPLFPYRLGVPATWCSGATRAAISASVRSKNASS